ncbi:auxiliary transport protein membrane fusion protein family protein [Prevotella sp. CAG:1124]|nr:auxiliary transport protein membrane fusion protein family protein [Prevotella sp. CAG:1124]
MEKKTFGKAAAILLLAAGATVIVTMFTDNGVERTDDAQVEQYISPVNVKVAGYIKEIRFTEHQFVHKGDTILIIDDREYAIALKQAEAQLMDARSGRKVIGNSVNTASSSATVLDASIEEAELRVEKLERDYRRYSALLEKKASTPVIVEQYKTELDMAKARVSALKRQREAARSTVSEVSQCQENADAAIQRAEAAVDMARLNLSYTVITAPADGYLGRRTIEQGQLVSPGQTITTLIPDGKKWVVANFKETQMARIRPGQSVEITVDAMPGKRFAGTVTAISQATGSKYSMVPTDNSAGNFVKIQQRVPVRIDFNGSLDDTANSRMAAGMMCEIKVDVKDD